MSDDGTWTVSPRPVPVELDPAFEAVEYEGAERTYWATIGEKLDAQTVQQLREIARGGIGDPRVADLVDNDEV